MVSTARSKSQGVLRHISARELALAAGAGLVFAFSPLTSNSLLPSAVAGVLAGGLVLGIRLWRQTVAAGSDSALSEAPAALAGPGVRQISPSTWITLVLWTALVAPTCIWLYHTWTASVWINDHGIFVPVIVGYLAFVELRRDPHPESEESSPWGLAWLLAGASLILLDAGVGSRYLSALGVILTLPGLSLLLLGPRRTHLVRVPLVVSLLAIPIPNTVASELFLRIATASGVEPLLHGLGITAFRDATVIHMARNSFVVSNACSGFATLYASVSVAIILACYQRSHVRKLLLLLAAPPLALGANVLRVLLLVLMTTSWGNWVIQGPLHPASGVATFCVALGGLFLIARSGSSGVEEH